MGLAPSIRFRSYACKGIWLAAVGRVFSGSEFSKLGFEAALCRRFLLSSYASKTSDRLRTRRMLDYFFNRRDALVEAVLN